MEENPQSQDLMDFMNGYGGFVGAGLESEETGITEKQYNQ